MERRRLCLKNVSRPRAPNTHTTHFLKNITHPEEPEEEEEVDDKMGDEMSFDSGMLKRFRDCVRHERRRKRIKRKKFYFLNA